MASDNEMWVGIYSMLNDRLIEDDQRIRDARLDFARTYGSREAGLDHAMESLRDDAARAQEEAAYYRLAYLRLVGHELPDGQDCQDCQDWQAVWDASDAKRAQELVETRAALQQAREDESRYQRWRHDTKQEIEFYRAALRATEQRAKKAEQERDALQEELRQSRIRDIKAEIEEKNAAKNAASGA